MKKLYAFLSLTWLILFLIGILMVLMFGACSAEKQYARFLKKHPEFVHTEIVKVPDTIRLPGTATDTVFRQSLVTDTVRLTKDRLTIKYFYSHDTVFLFGQVHDTTIIREVPVKVTTVSAPDAEFKKPLPWWWRLSWWQYAIALGIFSLFAIPKVRRR